jgi:hypothetical protein
MPLIEWLSAPLLPSSRFTTALPNVPRLEPVLLSSELKCGIAGVAYDVCRKLGSNVPSRIRLRPVDGPGTSAMDIPVSSESFETRCVTTILGPSPGMLPPRRAVMGGSL